jgi:hypothetical protein
MTRLFLASRSDPAGERFCVMRPDLTAMFPIGSVVDLPARMAAAVREMVWMTEEEARRELTVSGLSGEDVERQFARARSMRSWLGDLVMERTSTVGHRNAHGQIVVAKTDAPGPAPFERVFILRCERCGHEHRANGGDIHAEQCPSCRP